jgi:hypothetical protein
VDRLARAFCGVKVALKWSRIWKRHALGQRPMGESRFSEKIMLEQGDEIVI